MPFPKTALALKVLCLPIILIHIAIDESLKWWARRVEPMPEYGRRELIALVWIVIVLALARAIFY